MCRKAINGPRPFYVHKSVHKFSRCTYLHFISTFGFFSGFLEKLGRSGKKWGNVLDSYLKKWDKAI